ncbi:MAG: hypothetical protein CL920_21625 [Deltaproteobacteria bacterium]|nr:hypothetical protein [Deltaproteobacteria bacterium]
MIAGESLQMLFSLSVMRTVYPHLEAKLSGKCHVIVKLFFGEQKEVAERLENVTLRLENHLHHHEVPSR